MDDIKTLKTPASRSVATEAPVSVVASKKRYKVVLRHSPFTLKKAEVEAKDEADACQEFLKLAFGTLQSQPKTPSQLIQLCEGWRSANQGYDAFSVTAL